MSNVFSQHRKPLAVSLFIAGILTCHGYAHAQHIISWSAPVDGNWSSIAQWSPASVPDAGNEIAHLGHSTPYTVTIGSSSVLNILGMQIVNPLARVDVLGPSSGQTTLTMGEHGLLNNGLMQISSGRRLQFTIPFVIEGAGLIRLMPGAQINAATGNVVNGPSHIISGSGRILGSYLVNRGVIQADMPDAPMYVDTLQNESLLEARDGGLMVAASVVQNGSGRIRANNTTISLGTIEGGLLETVNGGQFNVPTTSLWGNLVHQGFTDVAPVSTGISRLGFKGVVRNEGFIYFRTTPEGGRGSISGQWTARVGGPGLIRVEDIYSTFSTELTNDVEHTIAGDGTFWTNGEGRIVNRGVILADVPDKQFRLRSVHNYGTMRAENGGILAVDADFNSGVLEAINNSTLVVTSVDANHDGHIVADGSSRIQLAGYIDGGVIETLEGGEIEVVPKTAASLNETTIRSDWVMASEPGQNASVTTRDGFVNDAVLRMRASGNSLASLHLQQIAVVRGSGSIHMETPGCRIEAAGQICAIEDHTVRGQGSIQGKLINSGTFIADLPGGVLFCQGIQNRGIMAAREGGILTYSGQQSNYISHNYSTVIAESGSTVRLPGYITQTGGVIRADGGTIEISVGTIQGGVIDAINGGKVVVTPAQPFAASPMIGGIVTQGEWIVQRSTVNDTVLSVLSAGLENNGIILLGDQTGGNHSVLLKLMGTAAVSGHGEIRMVPGSSAKISSSISSSSYVTRIGEGQRVTGEGTVVTATNGVLIADCTFAPGLPFGQIVLTRTTLSDKTVMEIELGGDAPTERDLINVTTPTELNGLLVVSFVDGYIPADCQEIPLLTGALFTGMFDHVTIAGASKSHRIRYTDDAVALVFASADYDGTGFVDTDDFTAFVNDFELGNEAADFDGTGFVDTDDFTAFVTAFETGC